MYKEIIIVRHGHAVSNYVNISDFDRPLTESGILAAYNSANAIKKKNFIPEIIFTSSAIRALHTASVIRSVLELNNKILDIKDQIYIAEVETLIKIISDINSKIDKVILVGHNPTLTYFSNYFNVIVNNLSPASFVHLKFKTNSWSEIKKENLIDSSVYLN
jgi:phosphohistidine phosphatase